MKIKDILNLIEQKAPLFLQESYDNSGVQTGNIHQEAKGVLLCIDVTEDVLDEAITLGCNLVIAHHPLAFKPFKSITGKSYIERCMIKAIKEDIVVYAAHTNLDNAGSGINTYLANMLGLQNIRILAPLQNKLLKLATFVPTSHADSLRTALFHAGAGTIGEYDQCSYNISGQGTFRASSNANPYVGTREKMHVEQEIKIETILPINKKDDVIQALLAAHPYEVPAYDIYPIINIWNKHGAGIVGTLSEEMDEESFLYLIKETFDLEVVLHSNFLNKPVKEIAICSGSGHALIKDAINYGADVFITGEAKYNDFYDVEDRILLAAIGHYESEIFTKKVFYDIISEKYPTFGVYIAGTDKNPVKYL